MTENFCEHYKKQSCPDDKCRFWFPCTGWSHCLKKYLAGKTKTALTASDIALLYDIPKFHAEREIEVSLSLALKHLFAQGLNDTHKIEFVDVKGVCRVCGDSCEGNLCLPCGKFQLIVNLENFTGTLGEDIYRISKDKTILFRITNTTAPLWDKFLTIRGEQHE